MKRNCLCFFVFLVGCFWSHGQTQQLVIADSLEARVAMAETDWEKLDLAIGLFRQYLLAPNEIKADHQLEIIYSFQNQIPEAIAYGLIMENIFAYTLEGNADKAIAKCLEAIEVSKTLDDKNTLAYARYQLAENYLFEKGDPQKALELMMVSLRDIDESVLLKTRGNSYKVTGNIYGTMGNYDSAHHYLNIALNYLKELVENPPLHPKTEKISAQDAAAEMHVSNTYNYMGDLYLKEGKTQLAVETKLQGLNYITKVNNKNEIAWMQTKIANLYLEIGDLSAALDMLQKSKITFEALGLTKDIKACNTQLINTHFRLGEYEEAEVYLAENIAYYQEKNDSILLAASYLQGVELFIGAGMYDQANRLLNSAEPIAASMQMIANRARIHFMRGNLSSRQDEPQNAIDEFRKAISFYEEEENLPGISKVNLEIANAYSKMGAYDSALILLDSLLISARKRNDLGMSRDLFEIKSEIFAKTRDFEKAYEAYQDFFSLHDSLFSINAQSKLKEEQVRQNIISYQNEKELAEQNAAILEREKQVYIIVGIIVFFILMLVAYLYVNLRQVKKTLQLQNEQLSQLNQTKDKFFGIIAHDLRSPLIGLQGVGEQVDYFLKKGKKERLEQVAKSISDTTKRLNELLNNLLNWALLQNGMIPYHPQAIDISSVVDSIFELLSPLAELKEIKMVNNLLPDDMVFADEKALHTILRNLISNSLKFTEKGGEVSISCENHQDHALILINDTGTGISAERLPKLFDLEKENSSGTMGEKGTGLGLVLCKELTELNHGHIWAESTLGKGSIFKLELPKAA